jgi:CubicO group peptidase (beta-lactamase class C family)
MDVVAVEHDLADRAGRDVFSGAVRIDQAGATLLRRGYGWASPTWQVAARPETRFDTASITKLFTAVATLQQVEAGAFALETPAIEYLELTDTAISPDVTVYQLLTHTSGIGDDADEEAGEEYADLFVDHPNYAIRQTADHLPHFIHRPANFAPGTGTRYCNCSYVLLGLMVERATGLGYRDYVNDRVFAPAKMSRSGFFAMDVVEPDVAEGLTPIVGVDGVRTGWRRSIYSYPPVGTPDGGAHTTVDDLVTFHGALREGRLLGGSLTQAMLSPHEDHRPLEGGRHKTGFGFEFSEVEGRVRSYWKEGSNTGVSAILRHYPGPDITVAVLSNLGEAAWEPIELIDRLVAG